MGYNHETPAFYEARKALRASFTSYPLFTSLVCAEQCDTITYSMVVGMIQRSIEQLSWHRDHSAAP